MRRLHNRKKENKRRLDNVNEKHVIKDSPRLRQRVVSVPNS